jgi:NAD(P)H-dependent flavin oxidoreductase YrpB (nitropropane dioxygenase family)
MRFGTTFARERYAQNKHFANSLDKTGMLFDLTAVHAATELLIRDTMSRKTNGAIFINVMEKLTMGQPRETLQARLCAALDAGIDGITLSAGLHMASFELMKENPRFHDACLGIIVSSARALKIFLNRAKKAGRMPDYIIVEGPLAGGHLGFPENWYDYDLRTIMQEVIHMVEGDGLKIPIRAAGGVFTGADALAMIELGASGIQVATRFAIAKESGLPDHIKQAFFASQAEDVVVNTISVTGYPMRMLRQSPAIGSQMPPQCEALGYALDSEGKCSYLDAYAQGDTDKTCLCSHMRNYNIWTCGHTVSRLKETTTQLPDGTYQQPSAAHVVHDYLTSEHGEILLPE